MAFRQTLSPKNVFQAINSITPSKYFVRGFLYLYCLKSSGKLKFLLLKVYLFLLKKYKLWAYGIVQLLSPGFIRREIDKYAI